MKFREIFCFEFVDQARRVRTWLYFALFFLAGYLLTRTAGSGAVFANSPYSIAQETVLTCLLWVLIAPAVAGSAAARDVQTRIPPISKSGYLGGRFLAAFVLNALILLAVPLGILAAPFVPGVDPHRFAPFRLVVYLSSYGVLALPTAFTFTAVQFSLAALKRRAIASYLGSVLFLAAFSGGAALALNVLHMPALGTLLDPTNRIPILVPMSDTLTPLEMNTFLIRLDGAIFANRVLWIGVALAILAFTHARFRLGHREA